MAGGLKAQGYECSEGTVAKLMSAKVIRARTPMRFDRTTDSNHRLPVAENLLVCDFEPAGPNDAWDTDTTYVPTQEDGLYLAVVEDLFSRMIVGWSMAESMESRLVVDAIERAVARRLPLKGSSALVTHCDVASCNHRPPCFAYPAASTSLVSPALGTGIVPVAASPTQELGTRALSSVKLQTWVPDHSRRGRSGDLRSNSPPGCCV